MIAEFILFVFTASVLILAAIKMAGAILGNGITLPGIGWLHPTNFIILYPSLLYQVGFWALHFGLFTGVVF